MDLTAAKPSFDAQRHELQRRHHQVRGVIPPGGLEPEHHLTRLRLVSLITMVATVGGLTAEAVFRKLLGIDVLRTGGLATDRDSKK